MASGCVLHDMVRELWIKINKNHVVYLTEENPSTKMKYRNNIQKYIHEYISVIPHHQKFFFRETADIIHNSIEAVKGCHLVKLVNAWSAISTYANNLYLQPWRKEYTEIKTYCGYYKHQIKSYLIGGERMLELMGYRYESDHTMVLRGNVDLEVVSSVSRDALIALTECQVILSLYKEISRKVPSCTLTDILEYRETHTNTLEQAIQGILYLHYNPPINYCNKCHNDYLSHGCITRPPPSYAVSPYQTCCNTCHVGTVVKPSSIHSSKNGYHPNCYAYSNGIPEKPPLRQTESYNIPTGKLIDVDNRHYNVSTSRLDRRLHDMRSKSMERYSSSDNYSNPSFLNQRRYSSKISADDQSATTNDEGWDTWGYVYQGLENKDRIKETRIDHSPPVAKYAPNKVIKLVDALDNLKLNSTESAQEQKNKYFTSRDAVDSTKSLPSVRNAAINTYEDSYGISASKNSVYAKSENNVNAKSGPSNGSWECITCTYHNSQRKDICEMCGKSRTVGSELKPLVSGGKQCPKCTLVNEKDAMICEACGNSLKDSPTYI